MAAAQLQHLTEELKQINGQIERALSPSIVPSSPSPATAASTTTSVPTHEYEVVREKAAYGDLRNATGNFDMDVYLASLSDDDENDGTGNSGGKKRSRRRKTLRRRRKTFRRKKNKGRVHVRR